MDFELGKVYSGFKMLEKRFIREIESTARLFIHEKSGARLLSIENDDKNKVFSISFRTPPVDNTGLTHILEHSVLCGSRKFPTKEPFLDLAKGSLNTFLNAMTFADKTMYPVASKNLKDFYNLMDVYLDAVFHPNIYNTPEIFMQEGWHYELNDEGDEIVYKGVVYNEMKGAFSSPEEVLSSKIMGALFPDTSYGLESGGDPDYIPELTYERFIDYHRKYYHPSNSYIYLYGDGNVLEELKFIDEKYLCDFEKFSIESFPAVQEGFSTINEVVEYYPVSSRKEEKDGTYMSLNFVTGRAPDRERALAFNILEYMLLETPASPLKRALLEADICKDVLGHYDDGILQTVFSIIIKGSNAGEREKFKKIVYGVFKELVKNGIDRKLIEASINSKEFSLREAEEEDIPKGLVYGIRCMDSWLYDESPFIHLEYEEVLLKIKSEMYNGYFEKLMKEYLMSNTHAGFVMLEPRSGLAREKELELREKLGAYKRSLTPSALRSMIMSNESLRLRQTAEDTPEAVNSIPMVSIEDINTKSEIHPLEERDEGGIKVLYHPIFTNGVIYFDLLFDTHSVPQSLLQYITLLSDVLGKINTRTMTYDELSKEIDINIGDIDFNVEVYEEIIDPNIFHPKLIIETKFIEDKLPRAVELIGEIILHSNFKSKRRLREIIQEVKSELETEILDDGHNVASKRLCSYFSAAGSYTEILTGIDYYRFISDLESNFSVKYKEIVEGLEKVSRIIFNRINLVGSVTCREREYEQLKKSFPQLVDKISDERYEFVDYDLKRAYRNEGMLTSSNIQYVAKGYNSIKLNYRYNGHLQVLKTILSLDYLWNKVRVQGGAYGAFARFEMSGNIYFCSYRDPNIKDTLGNYDGAEEYLRNFTADERDMTRYIIGTMSNIDFPLTASQSGQRADEYYFRKITPEMIQRERDEILCTSSGDIREFSKLIGDILHENYICVLGNGNRIKEEETLFEELVNIFE